VPLPPLCSGSSVCHAFCLQHHSSQANQTSPVHTYVSLPIHDQVFRRRKRNVLFLLSVMFFDRVSSGSFAQCTRVKANVNEAYLPLSGFPRPRQCLSKVARHCFQARCSMRPGDPKSFFLRTVFHLFPRLLQRAKRRISSRIGRRLPSLNL
jgi:hypothetical protein